MQTRDELIETMETAIYDSLRNLLGEEEDPPFTEIEAEDAAIIRETARAALAAIEAKGAAVVPVEATSAMCDLVWEWERKGGCTAKMLRNVAAASPFREGGE